MVVVCPSPFALAVSVGRDESLLDDPVSSPHQASSNMTPAADATTRTLVDHAYRRDNLPRNEEWGRNRPPCAQLLNVQPVRCVAAILGKDAEGVHETGIGRRPAVDPVVSGGLPATKFARAGSPHRVPISRSAGALCRLRRTHLGRDDGPVLRGGMHQRGLICARRSGSLELFPGERDVFV